MKDTEPIVDWTVQDIFKPNPKALLTYHVMGTPYDVFTPLGVILGGALYGIGIRPFPSALAMMGTSGLVAGCGGIMLGCTRLAATAAKGENASPPFTDSGIQTRVNKLENNFKVRILDLSVWSGIGVTAGTLMMMGGPVKLGLSRGGLGILQAVSLGSALGSLGAFGCIYSTSRDKKKSTPSSK